MCCASNGTKNPCASWPLRARLRGYESTNRLIARVNLARLSRLRPELHDTFTHQAQEGYLNVLLVAQDRGAVPLLVELIDPARTAEPSVRRSVIEALRILADPTAGSPSVPLVVVLLNGLRWVTGSMGLVTTGEPLTVGPLASGMIRIQRPDGRVEWTAHPGGLFRYEATDQTGRYRFVQGEHAIERLVNFLDPVESNTMTRLSTWGDEPGVSAAPASPRGHRHPLATWLLGLLAVVLMAEWGLYLRRGRRT